jgi:hypothetical protein
MQDPGQLQDANPTQPERLIRVEKCTMTLKTTCALAMKSSLMLIGVPQAAAASSPCRSPGKVLNKVAQLTLSTGTSDDDPRWAITRARRGIVLATSKRVDVHQVRDVAWAPRPLNDLEVPGGVIRRFVGTGSSFSRIHDDGARLLTPYLWEKLHERRLPQLAITPAEVLASHLDPYDVEDLVYVWLQVARGFVALPRARQRDTPAYEWTMIHRETGRRGIVQIKTGSEPVDLHALANARADDETDTFAFATCGTYTGDLTLVDEIIMSDQLLRFVAEHPNFLPVRSRSWFELAGP